MPAEAGIDDPLNNPDEMVMAGDSSFAAQQLTDAYPVGVPFRIAAYMQQREGLGQALETLKDYRFGVVHMAGVQGREVHVLVIGETGRPDRWQLNGYARPTTPRLVATENVVSFSNVISAWAWTRMSVPLILTRKPAVDKRAFFPEKSLIGAFREAGFRTYWFSTQSPLGVHDSSIAMHAREADETRFLNPVGYKGEGAHDEALLAPLRQVLARNESRQLIVLHTLGSHYNYADRYPEAFDVFRPSLKGRKDASLHDRSQALAMSNSYDNSVLYTDHLLAEVIDRVRATSARATLLYVADHGENLFDGRCDKSGHGHATERDFRVASIWWSSDAYASANPEKAALLRQRRDAPATTGHVFHTLLDLANIRYPGENRTRSLASPQWAPHPRWTQAGVDFDEARREPICKTLMRAPTRY